MSNVIIKINNVEMPSPSEWIPGLADLVTNSTRVGSGKIRFNFVDVKRTWKAKWTNINQDEIDAILTQIERVPKFSITCYDPELKTETTKTFYKSDRQWEKLQHINSDIFHTLSITFIEE